MKVGRKIKKVILRNKKNGRHNHRKNYQEEEIQKVLDERIDWANNFMKASGIENSNFEWHYKDGKITGELKFGA